jgi:hypothetical protein
LLGFIVWYSPAQLFFSDWNNLWHLLDMISSQKARLYNTKWITS